jgi:hypothetical protein
VVVNDDRNPPPAPPRRVGKRWWRPPALDPSAFHGFPALTFLPDGSLFAVWLDGRHPTGRDSEGEMLYASLYSAVSPDGGQSWNANVAIADSICSCCRPAAAADASGRIAVGYRSARGDLRDPALAVSFDHGATFPLDTVVSRDRWLLNACPADGPALIWTDADGGSLAWYTGAEPAGVFVLPWNAAHGAAGAKRALADSIRSPRHPRLATAGAGAWIAVEAHAPNDSTRAVVAVRAAAQDGALGPWTYLGSGARASALAALDPASALVCWTEVREGRPHVRLARLEKRS